MTAAPEDDADLGLNLVFSAPTPSSSTLAAVSGLLNNNNPTTTNTNPKRPKRKTKYDRRRERGRLAKLAKEDDNRNGSANTSGGGSGGKVSSVDGAGSSLAGIAAALSGGGGKTTHTPVSAASTKREEEEVKPPPTKTKEKELKQQKATIESENKCITKGDKVQQKHPSAAEGEHHKAESEGATTITDEQKEAAAKPADANTNTTTSIQKTNMSSQSSQPTIEIEQPTSMEGGGTSSRRQRAQTSLTEEQRDNYFSEFHARPRDLDRSERASKNIKASTASNHIFGLAVQDDDDDDNDSNDEGENATTEKSSKAKEGGKQVESTTATTTTTTCPFQKLGLHSNIVSTLTSPTGHFKLSQPTVVQSRSISALLPKTLNRNKGSKKAAAANANKKKKLNLFIQSETGSGKTLAYLLPILHQLCVNADHTTKRVDRQMGGTRAILLCPTRELATQTYATSNTLTQSSFPWIVTGCLSGGEKRKSEKARLRKGISILIATPGRLLDHLSKTECLLLALKNKLEWLVLDEADRLLDAGLGGQVEQIVQYLRSNQPRAGLKRDGVTWRSVLVSATVTSELEGLAKTVLGSGDGWMWARGHSKDVDAIIASKNATMLAGQQQQQEDVKESDEQEAEGNEANNTNELDNAAPRQLAQLYMVISAKLRLSSLIGFLAARASKGERTLVFLSTCDSVDYHHALFTSMESILGDVKDSDDNEPEGGIFGKACPIYKLHGDIPHNKRLATLKSFSGDSSSAILLATDVAARGLNFPSLDWIVQYDPPCETKDYVHRAGRSARAGQAGHALLFLLPSERQYVEVLQLRGLKEISALSLSSTLTTAAELCKGISQEGDAKALGNTFSDGRGEAFTMAIQNRLEQCVLQDDVNYKKSIEKKYKGDPKQRRKLKKGAVGPLLEGARMAFSAFVRAYPAKEKAVRHIFNARALHLGHIARSLALKETPKMVSKGNSKNNHAMEKTTTRDKSTLSQGNDAKGDKRKSRLAFGDKPPGGSARDDNDRTMNEDEEQQHNLSLLGDAIGGDGRRREPAKKKLKGGSARDVQKRMMEAAMMMQAQEFM